MKIKMLLKTLAILLILSTLACNDNSTDSTYDLIVTPIIKKSTENYTAEKFHISFPDSISLNRISSAYTNNYPAQVRNKLIEYIRGEVSKLGEDVNIFNNILSSTGCNSQYIIPTYVERAKYDGKEAWIIQLTYGFDTPSFHHFKCFAFEIETLDTLNYYGCK